MTSKQEFDFPECWSNDIRMSALFAPFRSKSINLTDWNSKMKFWTNLIENWCKHHKCPVIEISNLANSFSRKGSVPVCLEEVIQHLSSTGVIVLKDNFVVSDESWKSWAIKVLVTNPLKWTFNTVKSTIIKQNGQKEVFYIHLPVIKYLGEEMIKNVTSTHQGKLVNYEDLMKYGIENPEYLSLVVHWLQKQGKVAVHYENESTLVKILKSGAKQIKITETDMGIYSLERQEKLLENNIKKLETERNAALADTKKHLAAKMKNMAKISLRRKIEIEKTIEKRAVTLENIQAILHKIEQAHLDSEVVECYQKGIATLKRIFKETGLNEETVTGTMNELEDVLNSRNEIEEALARPMDPTLEENLEDELNELLLENAPEVPSAKLPEVPVTEESKVSVDSTVAKNKSKDADELENRMQMLSL